MVQWVREQVETKLIRLLEHSMKRHGLLVIPGVYCRTSFDYTWRAICWLLTPLTYPKQDFLPRPRPILYVLSSGRLKTKTLVSTTTSLVGIKCKRRQRSFSSYSSWGSRLRREMLTLCNRSTRRWLCETDSGRSKEMGMGCMHPSH